MLVPVRSHRFRYAVFLVFRATILCMFCCNVRVRFFHFCCQEEKKKGGGEGQVANQYFVLSVGMYVCECIVERGMVEYCSCECVVWVLYRV